MAENPFTIAVINCYSCREHVSIVFFGS